MSTFRSTHFTHTILFLVSILLFGSALFAQSDTAIDQTKQKAFQLIKEQKFVDALPLLERLSIEAPDDARVYFNLGFALIAKANVTKDDAEKKNLRVRSRKAFIKAKELGIEEPVVDSLIQGLPEDGGSDHAYSSNKDADKLVAEGESQFSKGELDAALKSYEKALKLDPNIYEAALFSGDVYVARGDFRKAEESYQRAIVIDPNRETAYRYSATPLMKQNKVDEARDRYIEAYITEPYNRFSRSGLMQWSQVTGIPVGHPKLEIPDDVEVDSSGSVKVDIGPNALLGGRENGTYFWTLYAPVRSRWRKETFAKAFPTETKYRHTLAEESEALRAVLAGIKSDKSVKKLDPSLETLMKLDENGFLESYLLLGRPDQGISLDHPKYLKDNRDKLRRYVKENVIGAARAAESKTDTKKKEDEGSASVVERSYDSAADKTSVKVPFEPITCVRDGCIFYSLETSYPGREASGKVERTVFALIVLTKTLSGSQEQAFSIQVDGKNYDFGKLRSVAEEARGELKALIFATTLDENELGAIANGKKVEMRFGQMQFPMPAPGVKAFAEFYNAAKGGR